MVQARLKKWLTTNWHFMGVILFFIIHGYSEHPGIIPFHELLLLLAILLVAGLLLYGISRKIFKANAEKAGLFTSFVFALVLFFGVLQDFLNAFSLFSLIGRLIIFLPLNILAIIVLLVWLRKTSWRFNKLVFFINSLLAIYVVVDLFIIGANFIAPHGQNKDRDLEKYSLVNCDTCAKPPVYLVLLDSYFGSAGLREYFQYENTGFESLLRQQGFHVVDSTHSNYKYTLYSMGSLLNMQYLEAANPALIDNHFAYNAGVTAVRNNIVCRFFKNQGYRVLNYSNFDIKDLPAGYQANLLPDRVALITQQTMYYRISKYLPLFLMRMGWAPGLNNRMLDDFVRNNEDMINLTLSDSKQKSGKPSFTYLHLMMPHAPFAFDSLGNRINIFAGKKAPSDRLIDETFLQYQVYTNKRIGAFIEQLKKETNDKAVILLMSDHGYQPAGKKRRSLTYQNLNAVYLPGGQYAGWYNGMTNVNQFRILFNTLFHQRLPLLKDSIVP